MTTKTPGTTLVPTTLYEGDNGRIHCGEVRCAGANAAYTGRTIAGQPVRALTIDDVREWVRVLKTHPCCEGCGRSASPLLDARGQIATRAGGQR